MKYEDYYIGALKRLPIDLEGGKIPLWLQMAVRTESAASIGIRHPEILRIQNFVKGVELPKHLWGYDNPKLVSAFKRVNKTSLKDVEAIRDSLEIIEKEIVKTLINGFVINDDNVSLLWVNKTSNLKDLIKLTRLRLYPLCQRIRLHNPILYANISNTDGSGFYLKNPEKYSQSIKNRNLI